MKAKKGIKILIFIILLVCTIVTYSNATSTAKYCKKGTLSYGVNYKKMTADLNAIKRSIPSETAEKFTYKFTFDRSGNSKDGEKDQYAFGISNNNLACSITSISDDSGNVSDNVSNITYDQVGTEKITVDVSCDVPGDVDPTEYLDFEVNVVENIYYTDTDKLTYNYLTESYSTNAGDYYERTASIEGIDPDNIKIYYMDKSKTDKLTYLLKWLQTYSERTDVEVGYKATYNGIVSYINSYNLNDSNINESMNVSGIKVESVDNKYKFTITDNFDNYVSTYANSNNLPKEFYFYEKNDSNNTLFFEYLEKYYKPLVNDNSKYNKVFDYMTDSLNGKNIIDWVTAGNRLGITYTANKYISVPDNIYELLTTTFKSFDFDSTPTANSIRTKLRSDKSIPTKMITQIAGTSTTPGYIVNCINGTDYDNYSYYIVGSVKTLVHVYYDSVNNKHMMDVTFVEENSFTLTYDSNVTDIDTLIENDVNSIKQNVGSGYTVSQSVITINGEGKKEITITVTPNS